MISLLLVGMPMMWESRLLDTPICTVSLLQQPFQCTIYPWKVLLLENSLWDTLFHNSKKDLFPVVPCLTNISMQYC